MKIELHGDLDVAIIREHAQRDDDNHHRLVMVDEDNEGISIPISIRSLIDIKACIEDYLMRYK